MRIRLGYVAISKNLNITSSSIMTYNHYISLNPKEASIKLNKIIMSNFRDLELILNYNIKHHLTFYRLTSNLIPLLTHDKVKIDIDKYKVEFEYIGQIIKNHHMRVDTHPDQFCVLNSVHDNVVEASVNILKSHQHMFELMKYKGKMIIHIGSSSGGKNESIKRFIKNFKKLDKTLQEMIIIENDDKIFNISDTLDICEKLHVPMVLDYHHHLCNNNGQKIEDYIIRIIKTWKDELPKIHFSSPKAENEKRAHNDYINPDDFIEFINKIKFINHDFDIMLEAKMKDIALFNLVSQLNEKTNYEFIDECTFLIKYRDLKL